MSKKPKSLFKPPNGNFMLPDTDNPNDSDGEDLLNQTKDDENTNQSKEPDNTNLSKTILISDDDDENTNTDDTNKTTIPSLDNHNNNSTIHRLGRGILVNPPPLLSSSTPSTLPQKTKKRVYIKSEFLDDNPKKLKTNNSYVSSWSLSFPTFRFSEFKNFMDLQKHPHFVNKYHAENISVPLSGYNPQIYQPSKITKISDITPESTLRIGPGIDNMELDDDLDTVTLLQRNKEQERKFGLKSAHNSPGDANNRYLRRQLLIYLSKIKLPIFQFVEMFVAACDDNSETEDFIWVFPEDIETLSKKEPRLYDKQTYGPDDFIKELFMLLAHSKGVSDANFKQLIQILSTFIDGLEDPAKFRTHSIERSSSIEPSSTASPPPKKGSRTDIEDKKKGQKLRYDGGSDEDDSNDGDDDEIEQDKVSSSVFNRTGFKDWQSIFYNIFREPKSFSILNKDPSTGMHPLALLILKPKLRGLLKIAQQTLNIAINQEYTLAQYMYSKDCDAYFAKFMASLRKNSSRNSGYSPNDFRTLGQSGNMPSASIINNYNRQPSRYNIADRNSSMEDAIKFFSSLTPAGEFEDYVPLPYSDDDKLAGVQISRPLKFRRNNPVTIIPQKFASVADSIEQQNKFSSSSQSSLPQVNFRKPFELRYF